MSKEAAQPQEHVCAALRMARAELLHYILPATKISLYTGGHYAIL